MSSVGLKKKYVKLFFFLVYFFKNCPKVNWSSIKEKRMLKSLTSTITKFISSQLSSEEMFVPIDCEEKGSELIWVQPLRHA